MSSQDGIRHHGGAVKIHEESLPLYPGMPSEVWDGRAAFYSVVFCILILLLVVFIRSQDLNQYQVFSNSLKSVRFKLIIFSKLFYIALNTQTPHHFYQLHHFNSHHHHHYHHYCDFLYFYTFLMPVKVISINKIIAINASNVFQCNIQSMKLLPKN